MEENYLNEKMINISKPPKCSNPIGFLGLLVEKMNGQNFDTFFKYLYLDQINSKTLACKHSIGILFEKYNIPMTNLKLEDFILDISPSIVASTLRQLRVQNRYSLKQLEKLTTFDKTSISHRESSLAKSYPNIQTVMTYLNVFNINVDEFLFLIYLNVIKEILS